MRRAASQRGITILEMMIVLGIVGLMMLIGFPALRSATRSDLRGDAAQIAAMIQAGTELATLSGIHHRLVLDLDAGTFKLEACPEEMRLRTGDKETVLGAEALKDVPEAKAGIGGAPGPLDAIDSEDPGAKVAASAALAGVQIGGARCAPATAPNGDAEARGNERTVRIDRGIKIAAAHVQHLSKPVTAGKVAINFFALGWSEKAIVELTTGEGDTFSVVLHGLTGRVELRGEAVDADRHMRRDAAGDEVTER